MILCPSLQFYSQMRSDKLPKVTQLTVIRSSAEKTSLSSRVAFPWSRPYPLKNPQVAVTGSLKIISVTLGRGQKKSTSASLLCNLSVIKANFLVSCLATQAFLCYLFWAHVIWSLSIQTSQKHSTYMVPKLISTYPFWGPGDVFCG